VKRNGVEKLN